jgi:hypothetical protein
MIALDDAKSARQVSMHRIQRQRSKELAQTNRASLENIFEQMSDDKASRPMWISLLFFIILIFVLVIGAASPDLVSWILKSLSISFLLIVLALVLKRYYSMGEIRRWGLETWNLTKKIFPILLLGVFFVGILGGVVAFFVPGAQADTAVGVIVSPYIGENSIISCFLSSVIGAILYMPTLLEVAIVGTLFGYTNGLMSDGPALSLLLAGPSLSLPNMIVITKVMGMKKAMVYFGLVVVFATGAGFVYGFIIS